MLSTAAQAESGEQHSKEPPDMAAITTTDDYAEAVRSATAAARSYYAGDEPLITDAEYDLLLEDIRDYEGAHPSDVAEQGLFSQVAAGVGVPSDVPHPAVA